jgi:hypothetical protein
MIRWFIGVMACLTIAGAAMAADLPADKINGFKTGVTTRAEVLASLGKPEKEDHNPDGRSVALYIYTVPLTEKNKTVREMAVDFLFDAHDVLLDAKFFTKDPAADAKPAATSAAASAPPGLQDENILVPLPEGFKVGSQGRQAQMQGAEFVPNGETVKDWSRMVTEEIFFGRRSVDPDDLPSGMAKSWAVACPGGSAERTARATENGYPVSLWVFRCPMNPQTHKPENMWMKVVSGQDALYSVQYAYRRALADDLAGPAMTYLGRVTVCDTRGSAHSCPSLQPVSR